AKAMQLSGAEATPEAIFNLYGDALIRQGEINFMKEALSRAFINSPRTGPNRIEVISVNEYKKYRSQLTDIEIRDGDAYFLNGENPRNGSVIGELRTKIRKMQLEEPFLIKENKVFSALLEKSENNLNLSPSERRVAEAVFGNIDPATSQRPTLVQAMDILNKGLPESEAMDIGSFGSRWYSFLRKVNAVTGEQLTSLKERMELIVSKEDLFRTILEHSAYFSPLAKRIVLVAKDCNSFKSNSEIEKLLDTDSGTISKALSIARQDFLDLPQKMEQDRMDYELLRRVNPEIKKLGGVVSLEDILNVRYDASGELIASKWEDVLRLLKENNLNNKISISSADLRQYFSDRLNYARRHPLSLVDPSIPFQRHLVVESYTNPSDVFGGITSENKSFSIQFVKPISDKALKNLQENNLLSTSNDPRGDMRETINVLKARYVVQMKDAEQALANAQFLKKSSAPAIEVTKAYNRLVNTMTVFI
ncbi:MAG: hypothetical protein AAB885_01070, partial [Patescibacteria group bacterium]